MSKGSVHQRSGPVYAGPAEAQATELVAERRGPHALVRRRGEAAIELSRLDRAPAVVGQILVLVTPGAAQAPSLAAELPSLLRPLAIGTNVRALRIGLPGYAADPRAPQFLADRLDVAVFAPDGPFCMLPEAAWYAGHGTGGTGWRLFRPNLPAGFGETRHPVPAWSAALPDRPVVHGDVVAEPVPAGLLVRDARARPAAIGQLAFAVAVEQTMPHIVVGGNGPAPAAASVAAVVMRTLPNGPFLLVPAAPEVAAYPWLVEFALGVGREVMVTTGVRLGSAFGISPFFVPDAEGQELFRPFATVIRQSAGGGDQQVLETAQPPPGWHRAGPRTYQYGEVRADVVPSGLVLRTGEADPGATARPFDPTGWTLYLGVPGEAIGQATLAAAQQLLDGLGPRQRPVVRLQLVGHLDDRASEMLGDGTVLTGPTARPAVVHPAAGSPSQQEHATLPAVEPPRAAEPPRSRAFPVPEPPAAATQPLSLPPQADSRRGPAGPIPSGMPIMTSSGAPSREQPQADVSPPAEIGRPEADPLVGLPPAGGSAIREPMRGEGGDAAAEIATAELPVPPLEAAEPPVLADAAGGWAPTDGGPVGRPTKVAERASTNGEQTRFTSAAGGAFGEALATVNAALATWPSMRQGDSPGVKADYIAVCLFLSSGEGAAAAVNRAVRAGREAPVDGQTACLSSGIRRLPTHRRPVLRQGKVGESLEHGSVPGAVLTEPGFLAASIDLDVTVPGADLDVLIWPSSARRTSELMIGRPISEVLFVAGARFKALAVRTAETGEPEDDGPVAPRIAVLFRELAPGESPSGSGELDERDLAVLEKLDRVLARRQGSRLRLVDEPGLISRLTTSMVAWHEELSSPDPDARPAMAS